MHAQPGFSIEVDQRKHISVDDNEIQAVLTVTGQGLSSGSSGSSANSGAMPTAAEVVLVDCSGSMSHPATKIAAARQATAAAIEALRDGVLFAVVEGTEQARLAYPAEPPMVAATPETRAAARAAVSRLHASGGTAFGTWLALADELLEQHPGAIRHAILLTDGRNREEPGRLDKVLAQCAEHFACDAQGIGDGWDSDELLRVVSTLRGQADAVRRDADLPDVFRTMMRAAMRKVVPELVLRVRTTREVRLRYVKQVHPTELDLTPHGVESSADTVDFGIGPWGDENREYLVRLDVDSSARPLHEDIQLAMVSLLTAGSLCAGPKPLLVNWTSEPVQPHTWIGDKVWHYTEHTELRAAVVAGCDAADQDDTETAEREWGRAVKLATALGNEKILATMRHVVDIVDDDTGRVRRKQHVQLADLKRLRLSSVHSSHSRNSPFTGYTGVAGDNHTCPCGRISPANVNFCTECGRPLSDSSDGTGS